MSYGTIYTLPFKSVDGNTFLVKVEREGYSGSSKELKGTPSPFVVSIDNEDDFIYNPIRFSTATLSVFGSDYLQGLFSTDYRMHRVTLYKNNSPVWCGFIKPEVYTQDYRSPKFPLELECYSAMSVLEYVDYRQAGESRGFVSLWDLLKRCISESRGQYTAVYVPHVYGRSKSEFDAWTNPLLAMQVSEQNFFDEDDKPMTLKKVLEEVMKLLNWTCTDWRGELYFVDVDNEDGDYYRYDLALSNYTKVKADAMQVQEIGFAGADHTLDIVPGYNKVTVRCSNYPVGEALPDMGFDRMRLFATLKEATGTEYDTYYKFYNSDNPAYRFFFYKYDTKNSTVSELSESELKEVIDNSASMEEKNMTGGIPIKFDDYGKDEDKVDYTFTEEIYIPIGFGGFRITAFKKDNAIPILKVKGAVSAYSDGAFAIGFSMAMKVVNATTLADYNFRFQLRIGEYYYHGDGKTHRWDKNPSTVMGTENNLRINIETTYEGPFEIKTQGRELGDGFDGAKGYVCHLPDDRILNGDLELTLFAPYVNFYSDFIPTYYYVALRDFNFSYHKREDTGEEESDSDRTYENVVNENYINELDEIEWKISSYNHDGACYSKVVMGDGYLENNLYCGITGGNVRPEELFIRRVIDHYSATKIKLTQVLKRADIKPYTVLSDKFMVNRKYLNIGGEIDYKMNRFTCIMLEI